MWRATIKGLLAHKVRLGLTALAVVLGVAFVSGTFILSDTMNKAFDGLFRTVNEGVAVVVQGELKFKGGQGGETAGPGERVPASVLDGIRTVPGVKAAEGSLIGYAQVVGTDGKPVSTGGAPTFGASWISDPILAVTVLRQGHPPESDGQVAIDARTAMKGKVAIGQRIEVLTQGAPIHATVVGIFGYGKGGTEDSLGGATFVAFDPATAQVVLHGHGKFDNIRVAAQQGVTPETLRGRIQAVLPPGFTAATGTQQAASDSQDVKDQLKFLTIGLLVFAGISLFVGAFIIFNTFSILVTQRTRELALLRALGALPSQVRRSVVVEAAIVGLVASAIGIVAGFGIALGLQGLLKLLGAELPSTGTQFLPRTIIAGMVVGTVTTLAASIGPAVRASRVPPIAALRDSQPTAAPVRSLRRTIIGFVVLAAGVAALAAGLFGNASNGAATVGVGAALVFFAVAVLSPLVARPMARVIGAPFARLGIAGRLGRENASRNPRRTASTAAALMIGLALVAFVSIFAASLKASATDTLAKTLKADYIVSNPQFQPFSTDVAARLAADDRFGAVAEFRTGIFGLNGIAQALSGVTPETLGDVSTMTMTSGRATLGTGELLVDAKTATSHGWHVGDTVHVEFARTGAQDLKIVGIYEVNQLLGPYLVSLGTFEANFAESSQLDQVVLLKTAPGVSHADAKAAIREVTKAFPNVRIQDQAEFRKTQAALVDQLLAFVTALLALALIIALFGIVNTLVLSVFERTREIGLLRAVGMSRRQTRGMVRWEAVIIAVFGAVLGIIVGAFFGWAMVQALKDQGVSQLAFPVGQLIVYVIIAGIAGVVAAILPARHAARLDVLRAVTTE